MGYSAFSSAAPVILVMGDSLSAAYGIEQREGWVNLLQQRLSGQGYLHQVANASISGETSSGGLTRIESELERLRPSIVIIALGANDGLRGLSLKALKRNLGGMVERAEAYKARVLLIGMRLPPNYGPVYNGRFQKIFRELAKEHDTVLLPFLLEGLEGKRELFLADAFHPNAEAQPLILELVWKALMEPLRGTRPDGGTSN